MYKRQVIEFARNVLGYKDASSTEVNPNTQHPIIDLMPDQIHNLDNLGGTLRLGGYSCLLKDGSIAKAAYGRQQIRERHRHRYEFNNDYIGAMEEAGMSVTGINEERNLVEIVELPRSVHPWFVAVQFHPEFKSRPNRSHPLFKDFIRASLEQANK